MAGESEVVPTRLVKHGYEYFGIPRVIVIDQLTNPDALAIYTYLQARGPDWRPQRSEIMQHFDGLGRTRYQNAWNMLKELGLGWVTDCRDASGRVVNRVLNVSAIPLSGEQRTAIDLFHTQSQEPNFEYRGETLNQLKAMYTGDLFEDLGTQSQDSNIESTQSPISDGRKSTLESTQSQDSDIESDGLQAPENHSPTQSPISDGRKSVPIINNNKNIIGDETQSQDPDIEYSDSPCSMTTGWRPRPQDVDRIASEIPGIDREFITSSKVVDKFIDWWTAPANARKRYTPEVWANLFAKHVDVNWKNHVRENRIRIPEWQKRGYESQEAFDQATLIQMDRKRLGRIKRQQLAAREQGKEIPACPELELFEAQHGVIVIDEEQHA